jgi:GNAT superfamily N-acetyltransferase
MSFFRPLEWVKFSWDPGVAAGADAPLDALLTLRGAEEADQDGLRKAVQSGLLLDPEWKHDLPAILRTITARLDRLFTDEDNHCTVVCHGKRVIAMSLMDARAESPGHLVSGPLVLPEYRNRGIGSALLRSSLAELATRGVAQARGLVPRNSLAARFVYPKFGGVAEECPGPPLETAA